MSLRVCHPDVLVGADRESVRVLEGSLAKRNHDAWGPGVEAEGRVTFTSMEDKDVAVRIDPDATRLAG